MRGRVSLDMLRFKKNKNQTYEWLQKDTQKDTQAHAHTGDGFSGIACGHESAVKGATEY